MASGNVRYVRYIIIAVFTLFLFYYISNSKYEGVSIRNGGFTPGSSTQPQSHQRPVQVDDSSLPSHQQQETEPQAPVQPKPGSPAEPPIKDVSYQLPGTSNSDGHDSSSDSIGIMPSNSKTESPLALTPNDPGWDSDLVGIAPGPRMNATFVTLARNSDIWEIAKSIRQVEDRFNRRYNYDWVFLNDKPFDATFKKVTSSLVSGKTFYGEIPTEHWSFPEWIDQDKAKKVREDMKARKIIYGDSISYRHMCRFESGFFFRHPLMLNYEWYWRVEPSIELYCDVHYDPFRVMAEKGKKYSFVLSLYEYVETIPTLWESTKKFMKNHPEHIAKDNSMGFLSDDGGDTYNHCHFWSNFEVGSLEWLRSDAYIDFFESLDRDGGFFYERWGDAPVHSIAAGLLLPKDEIHFFNDIAYWHVPFTHCPTGEKTRLELRCHCNPKENFDWKGYSCKKTQSECVQR
jgi:alpha 1,2-mannosyltransferase